MIDEIITKDTSQEVYNKEAYMQRKKEQKEKAYIMIDEALEELKNSPVFLKEYLDVQARFDMYTSRNALLIAKQLPTALQLKTKKDWLDSKATFRNPSQKSIIILEPGEAYIAHDGRTITPINSKEVIDILETNGKFHSKIYDKKFILQSILHECPIGITVVNNLESGKICEWNKEDGVIYACRNDDYDSVIRSLTTEIGKFNLYESTNEIDNDKADCISYMICKKYDIETPINCLDNLCHKYSKMENIDIANDLTSMKEIVLDINTRMGQYLDAKKKVARNNEQER